MRIEPFTLGPFQTNSYLLVDESTKCCAVIDPSFDSESILDRIGELGVKVQWILNTHGHCDHIFNNGLFVERTGAPIAIHRDDLKLLHNLEDQLALFGLPLMKSPSPDRLLEEGDIIRVGEFALRVLHTPGHSPGGIALVVDDVAFVGDTLFAGSIGRTDLPGGDLQTLLNSIQTGFSPCLIRLVYCRGMDLRQLSAWKRGRIRS